MARYECTVSADFDALAEYIRRNVLEGSVSASFEDRSDFEENGCRCTVLVFERYSFTGSSRLSLNVTLFEAESGNIHVSAIASGGSKAMLLKVNTFGEESFLAEFRGILNRYAQ